MNKTDLKNLTLPALEKFLQGQGKERFRATQIFKWIYQHDARSFEEMTNISKELRRELSESAVISDLEPEAVEEGGDGTKKYLFSLEDGHAVERPLLELTTEDLCAVVASGTRGAEDRRIRTINADRVVLGA